MVLCYTERFRKSYEGAPTGVQRAFDRKVALMVGNLRHPSLRAKKYHESGSIWQARVNNNWRFYFTIKGGTHYLIDNIPHPK